MKKQRPNESNNKILEAYYAGIGEAHIDNIINDLEMNKFEIEALVLPESLDKWVHEYDEREKRAERWNIMLSNMKQLSKRAAIIILILVAAMSALMFSVEAVRIKVLNLFIEVHERYTEVRVEEESFRNLTPDLDWENYYSPQYLPKGYFFANSYGGGLIKVLEYTDGVNEIVISQGRNGSSTQLDTEDAEVKEIIIDGKDGLLITEGDRVMIFWYNEEASFTLIGHVSSKEMIKIAENIKKVDK